MRSQIGARLAHKFPFIRNQSTSLPDTSHPVSAAAVSREELQKLFGCDLDPQCADNLKYTEEERRQIRLNARLRASLYEPLVA